MVPAHLENRAMVLRNASHQLARQGLIRDSDPEHPLLGFLQQYKDAFDAKIKEYIEAIHELQKQLAERTASNNITDAENAQLRERGELLQQNLDLGQFQLQLLTDA